MSDTNHDRQGGRLLIVTYHYVRDKGGSYPGIHPVTKEKLAQQIEKLQDHFHPASVKEVTDFAKNKYPLARDSFFITFDDGLVDHFTTARPVLDKAGIKAAFFVPTRPHIDALSPAVHKIHWLRANVEPSQFTTLLNEALPEKWSNLQLNEADRKRASKMHIHDKPEAQALKFALNFIIPHDIVDAATSKMLTRQGVVEAEFCKDTFMDDNQIRQLAVEEHMIGLHGHDHVPLSSLDTESMNNDVKTNKDILHKILGFQPGWLSYPYGRPDAIPINPEQLCHQFGIDAGFTLSSGFNDFSENYAVLKRITPNELDNFIPQD